MPAVSGGRPLEGLRVLDFSQYVAGPFCGMLLADLGADVVKVERPNGDAYRRYDPVAPDQSLFFCSLNRGKRSVVCDLSDPEGRRLAERLIAGADAVVHNFVPARAAAFGLDAASVERLNPKAVVCAVSAFGTDGPEAGAPGYDLIAQAITGLLALGARPGQEVPERVGGIPLADFTAGLLAAVAILSGLVERFRRGAAGGPTTSPGAFEVSLLGACLTLQAQELPAIGHNEIPARLDAATLGEMSTARAAARAIEPYYRCYATADAFVAVGCLDVAQRRKFLRVLGLEDPMVANPQLPPADEEERATRLAFTRQVEAALAAAPAAEWLLRFADAGVPAAELRSTAAAVASEQAAANGLVVTLDQPGIGPLRLLGGVVKRGGEPLLAERAVPLLGEHQSELDPEQGAGGGMAAAVTAAPIGGDE